LPLSVVITRKLGAPFNEEYAIGAVAENDAVVLNEPEIKALGISDDYIRRAIRKEQAEIERRIDEYRGGRKLDFVRGRTVILVDDGVATGYTMLAAVRAVRRAGPKQIIVAVPVAPRETVARLQAEADSVVVLDMPVPFYAVGHFYENFAQVSDSEVEHLLADARAREARRQRSLD